MSSLLFGRSAIRLQATAAGAVAAQASEPPRALVHPAGRVC